MFSFDGAFPGVIFNQEIAAQVVQFVSAVGRLFDESALLGLEADTLDRVTDLEEKGPAPMNVFVEPTEKDGHRAWKGMWLMAVERDSAVENEKGLQYPVLPFGAERGFLAPASSLLEIDVGPIAKMKSNRYRGAILQRVQGRLQIIKGVAEQVTFVVLRDKLDKLAKRAQLFTIF